MPPRSPHLDRRERRRWLVIVALLTMGVAPSPVPEPGRVSTWSFTTREKITCTPPLSPFKRRSVGRGSGLLILAASTDQSGQTVRTYQIPDSFFCPTGFEVNGVGGQWTDERGGRLQLMETEANTVVRFKKCYDLDLTITSFAHELTLRGSKRLRGALSLVGTVSRDGRTSQYRETEHLKGRFVVTDKLLEGTRANASDGTSPTLGSAGAGGV